MNGIFLLLGTNLGDRMANLTTAIELLRKKGINVKESSAIYETAPWGITDQPHFLNMVIRVEYAWQPKQLLIQCLEVEMLMGRERLVKWGARIIDIDILFFNNQLLKNHDLMIPHPGIVARRFTLLPLHDLIPNEIHLETGQSIKELLDTLPDDLSCKRTSLKINE